MDVESKATIEAAISDAQSAIDASVAKAVANFSTATSDLIIDGTKHFSETVAECVQSALADVGKLLAAQDGWTLKIGPIVIPEFSIVLEKPKS